MRHSSTYRSERRNEWRLVASKGLSRETWPEYNGPAGPNQHWQMGTPHEGRGIGPRRRISRSKYMPHIGKKRGGAGPIYA